MTNYLDIIWELSLKNQPAIDYITLCGSAVSRELVDGYIEKHHILPKCICNDNTQKLDKSNLVVLTAREHFLAHQLLSQMFIGQTKRKMLYALSGLCFRKNGEQIFNADEYAIIKEASRIAKRGIPLTEEHKQKIKDSFAIFNPNIGRKISDETRLRQSNAKMGKPHLHSDETRVKLSLSKLQKPDVVCPHCSKIGRPGGMERWHFNNCKSVNK